MPRADSSPGSSRFLLLGVSSSSIYAISYIFVRLVGRTGIHPFQIALFRNVVCLVVLTILANCLGNSGLRPVRPTIILLRGALSAMGLLLWFYGLVHLPIAEASTLSLTTVCFAAVGAALFLGERITTHKTMAIFAALGGALAIIRPASAGIQIEGIAVLAAAACWGAAACLVRRAAQVENALTIAFWSTLVMTVFTLPPAIAVWTPPSAQQLGFLVLIGGLTALATLTWTAAFKSGQTAQVVITDFVQLAWGVLIGLVAGEGLEPWSLTGILLITTAAVLIYFDRPYDTKP